MDLEPLRKGKRSFPRRISGSLNSSELTVQDQKRKVQLKRMLVEAEEERMVEEEQWWKKEEMRQVERKKVGERKQILNGVFEAGGAVEEDGGEGAAGVVEMKEERKVLKKFFAGRREKLQMSREAMSESLGHRLRQPDERGKKIAFTP
ncbi:hypothetical protein Taro_009665, partial [Colocasia esculenta]|nr:hypothetical protein [Colocasia esculenta]